MKYMLLAALVLQGAVAQAPVLGAQRQKNSFLPQLTAIAGVFTAYDATVVARPPGHRVGVLHTGKAGLKSDEKTPV